MKIEKAINKILNAFGRFRPHIIGHKTAMQEFFEGIDMLRDLEFGAYKWVEYDWDNRESHPEKYGKYFVRRKDGKIHWETWNGSGWAYNGNVITHYVVIYPPDISNTIDGNATGSHTKRQISVDEHVLILRSVLEEVMVNFDSEEDRMDFILDICNGYKKRIDGNL